MLKAKLCLLVGLLVLFVQAVKADELAKHLQEISVTVKAGASEGSGVIITRELKLKSDSTETKKVNFIWTAGHVVDSLRSVRTVINAKGEEKKTIEFKEAQIVKELVEDGRKVGELKMDAQVVKYSDADNGQDLALLMIRKQDFVQASAKFYLKDDTVPLGTPLFHVGSLLGQAGANSMTSGIMSQVGRVLELGKSSGAIFDQTTCTAMGGSSGGGVYLATEGEDRGKCVGILVRGVDGFNLIVPSRRVKQWCGENNLLWSIDESVPSPTIEELKAIKVEDSAAEAKLEASKAIELPKPASFQFLIQHTTPDVTAVLDLIDKR